MAKKKVLAIGIDPASVDFSAMPQFLPEMFRNYIDDQVERIRALGFDVALCLIDLGDTAEAVTATALNSGNFDCVMIGAGLREGREKIINLVHRLAPGAPICFAPANCSGYSMISSARPSNDIGSVRPIALAVFRLTINSTFVA
jgi:hypothetical protein